jgi:hypothetical protein
MREISPERRRLLINVALWLGGASMLVLARSANAFQTQSISPGSSTGLAYSNRCGGSAEHASLVSQLRGQLADNPSSPSVTATCPICGCPVTVSR